MIRAGLRGIKVAENVLTGALILFFIQLHILLLGSPPVWRPRFVRWWHHRLGRALEIQINTNGVLCSNCLLVSNHISWLDIPVIGAQGEIGFLAKSEVRAWPLIGWMAATAGTLFIKRGANQIDLIIKQIAEQILNGKIVSIFPEGTTTDGRGVQRFHPRLFSIAKLSRVNLQPVAIRYCTSDDPTPDQRIPFIGQDILIANLWRVLRHPKIIATLHFLPPLIINADEKRNQIAERVRLAILTTLECSIVDK